ncbi:MAG: hypothetical protein AVDCRST_MAG15-1152, partial [uncultured Rubellimicrobium sp.]
DPTPARRPSRGYLGLNRAPLVVSGAGAVVGRRLRHRSRRAGRGDLRNPECRSGHGCRHLHRRRGHRPRRPAPPGRRGGGPLRRGDQRHRAPPRHRRRDARHPLRGRRGRGGRLRSDRPHPDPHGGGSPHAGAQRHLGGPHGRGPRLRHGPDGGERPHHPPAGRAM